MCESDSRAQQGSFVQRLQRTGVAIER